MITHKGTKTIYTERLTLRPFTLNDAQGMYDNWASDPQVTRFVTWQPHASVEETTELLKLWCAGYAQETTYNWVMDLNGTPIGNVSVVHINDKNEKVELGYCMSAAYWNKGYMTEAVRAVIDYLFKEVGVNRILISHAVDNPASGRVAQKCGCTFEGISRQDYKSITGEYWDIANYSILKEEWQTLSR